MSLRTSSMHLLNTSKDGGLTTSFGSLFQGFAILSMKKFFVISNLNLPWWNLNYSHFSKKNNRVRQQKAKFTWHDFFGQLSLYWRTKIGAAVLVFNERRKTSKLISQWYAIYDLMYHISKVCQNMLSDTLLTK